MLTNKIDTADVLTLKLINKITSADIQCQQKLIKGAHLLAIKTNWDVEMTDYGKSTKVRMVNESQVRTFIISDKTCEIQS